MILCAPYCWTPTPCPVHPQDDMPPRGRALPEGASTCCEVYMQAEVNPRHLWHEHDSTRWYTDPDGWNAHAANCDRDDCEPIDVTPDTEQGV